MRPPLLSTSNLWIGPTVMGYIHRRPGHHFYIIGEEHTAAQARIPRGHHILDAFIQEQQDCDGLWRPMVYAELDTQAIHDARLIFSGKTEQELQNISLHKNQTIAPIQRLHMDCGLRMVQGRTIPFNVIACNCRFHSLLALFNLLSRPHFFERDKEYYSGELLATPDLNNKIAELANRMQGVFYKNVQSTRDLVVLVEGMLLGEEHPAWFTQVAMEIYDVLPPDPIPPLVRKVRSQDAPYFERYAQWIRAQISKWAGEGVFEHWREWITRTPRNLNETPVFMTSLSMLFQDAFMVLKYWSKRSESRVHVFLVGSSHVDALMRFFGHRARIRSMWSRKDRLAGINVSDRPVEWIPTINVRELHTQVLSLRGGESQISWYEHYWKNMRDAIFR